MAEPSEQPPIVPAEDVARRYALEERKINLDAGILGGLFGSAATAPTNIAGIIVLLLTVACIVSLFVPSNIPALEFLKLVLPVITGILGYLFGIGKSTKE